MKLTGYKLEKEKPKLESGSNRPREPSYDRSTQKGLNYGRGNTVTTSAVHGMSEKSSNNSSSDQRSKSSKSMKFKSGNVLKAIKCAIDDFKESGATPRRLD